MSRTGRSRRNLARLQWVALSLCVAAITINYVDRATVAVATVDIRHDFHLSATAIGAMTSVWSICFALSQLPTGFLVDRVGGRLLLGCALLLWSVAQAAGGFARSFTQLLWIRAGLGIGEAPAYPTSTRVTSIWFRREERGLPSGVYNASSQLGPAIAPPLLTMLMLSFGWRAMFMVMGAVGIVICLLWVMMYRDPDKSGLTAAEQATLGERQIAPVTFRQWADMFRYRTMWGLIAGGFGMNYVGWMFMAWLPAYLEMQQHISIAHTGVISSIPWIFGIVGSLSGGFVSDRLGVVMSDSVVGRRLPFVYGMLGLGCFTLLAAYATSADTAVVYICVAVFFLSHGAGAHWTLASTMAPPNRAACCASIQNCGGFIGASLSPIITGFVVDQTGSFSLALLIAAGVAAVTAVLYHMLIGTPVGIGSQAMAGLSAVHARGRKEGDVLP